MGMKWRDTDTGDYRKICDGEQATNILTWRSRIQEKVKEDDNSTESIQRRKFRWTDISEGEERSDRQSSS